MNDSMPLSLGRRIALLEHVIRFLDITIQERELVESLRKAYVEDLVLNVTHVHLEIFKGIAQKCRNQQIDPEYGTQLWLKEEPTESGWYTFSRHELQGWVSFDRQTLENTGRLIPQEDGDHCYIEVKTHDQ